MVYLLNMGGFSMAMSAITRGYKWMTFILHHGAYGGFLTTPLGASWFDVVGFPWKNCGTTTTRNWWIVKGEPRRCWENPGEQAVNSASLWFPKSWGYPQFSSPVLIHFRWGFSIDFPWNKPSSYWGIPYSPFMETSISATLYSLRWNFRSCFGISISG